MNKPKMLPLPLILACALASTAWGDNFSKVIGDKDGFGIGVAIGGKLPFNASSCCYDLRDAAEAAATDGSEETDIYSPFYTNVGIGGPQSFTFTFVFSGTLTSATLSSFVGGLQARALGPLTVTVNGINDNTWLNAEDGETATAIHSLQLTAAMLAAANSAGKVSVTISRGSSRDFVIFDYFQLDGVTAGGSPGPTETVRYATTVIALPSGNCPATPTPVTTFPPTAASVYFFMVLDGIQLGDTFSDKWLDPSGNTYQPGFWDPAVTVPTGCYYDRLDVSGHPPSSLPGNWTIQVFHNQTLLTTVHFTIGANTPPPQSTGGLAHLAAGGEWTTGIFAVNTGIQMARFSIYFYGDGGKPILVPFSGGAINTLQGTLQPQGSAYYEASNPLGQLVVGWGQIVADPSIVIQGLFRRAVDGIYYEAGVPSSSTGSKEFIFPFDATTFAANGSPFYTGFAIANLDQIGANVTCTARDSSGRTIPNALSGPTLSPLGHWASNVFPALTGLRGTIDCVSNTNVAAVALRFIGTNAFSSLPVIP